MDSLQERYSDIAWSAWERYCAEREWDPTDDELGLFRVFCAGYACGVRRDMKAVPTG